MAVNYDIIGKDGSDIFNRRGTACFGALAAVGSDIAEASSHITYWPKMGRTIFNDSHQESINLWHEFLSSLPVIMDALVDYKSEDGLVFSEVSIRTDLPSDRLVQTLGLIRMPYVMEGTVRAFKNMLDMDIDPSIAFALSVGIQAGYESTFTLSAGRDTEHSFVDPPRLSIRDCVGLATTFCAEDFADRYAGRQKVWQETGTYRRGDSMDDNATRLTAWAAPDLADRDASDEMLVPAIYWALKLVKPEKYQYLVRENRTIGNLRLSELGLSDEELLKLVSEFESLLPEES